jgi:hypothetical protein
LLEDGAMTQKRKTCSSVSSFSSDVSGVQQLMVSNQLKESTYIQIIFVSANCAPEYSF